MDSILYDSNSRHRGLVRFLRFYASGRTGTHIWLDNCRSCHFWHLWRRNLRSGCPICKLFFCCLYNVWAYIHFCIYCLSCSCSQSHSHKILLMCTGWLSVSDPSVPLLLCAGWLSVSDPSSVPLLMCPGWLSPLPITVVCAGLSPLTIVAGCCRRLTLLVMLLKMHWTGLSPLAKIHCDTDENCVGLPPLANITCDVTVTVVENCAGLPPLPIDAVCEGPPPPINVVCAELAD